MNLDELRSDWNNTSAPVKTAEDIRHMLAENKHPVLKQIRKQLTIELVAYIAFLLCYYTMFDGDLKPIYINVILISCILFPLLHNLAGYRFSRYLVNGGTLKQSLANYFYKVRIYAFVSVTSRIVYAAGLLAFFTYGINFNMGKYYLLAVAILAISTQLFWLVRLWFKRINQLKQSAHLFN